MEMKSIGWGDGTTGKIFVSFSGSVGSSQVSISSDPNTTSSSRRKTLTFKSSTGIVLGSLSVFQQPQSRDYSTDYSADYR